MALRDLILPEHTRRTFQVQVVDANGDPVVADLTAYKVYFYVHDLAAADGTNRIALNTVDHASQISVTDGPNCIVQIMVTQSDVALTEADEDEVSAVWVIRWENSAGSNDTDEYTLEQPCQILRNRVIPG